MTKEQKIALAKELHDNFDMTKEQYIETCKLVDELGLEPYEDDPEPEEDSWDSILDKVDITNK